MEEISNVSNVNELIDNKELREKLIERCDVLEKVKTLLLIKGTDFATTKQVAEFYEVDKQAIKDLLFDHRDEVEVDGLLSLTGTETKEFLGGCLKKLPNFTNQRGCFQYDGITFNNKLNLLFSRRAILRVGMLLRDSEVAKEVRTQLLNIEEKVEKPVKVLDITEEQRLIINLGEAYASGDFDALAKASVEMNAFKNRHIEKLNKHIQEVEAQNNKLSTDNKALAKGILEWSDRAKLNAGIRKLAIKTGNKYDKMFSLFYRGLRYKYGISLTERGDRPYIQYIRKDEWDKVMKLFSAICENHGWSPSEMIGQIE